MVPFFAGMTTISNKVFSHEKAKKLQYDDFIGCSSVTHPVYPYLDAD